MSLAAIILAAGESTRMGRPKPLLPWGDDTLVEWQVEQLVAAGATEVVVVLGYEADAIGRRLADAPARCVVNAAYREGRASSLRCGAAALTAPVVEAVLILGVDQPRPAWLTRLLIERWRLPGGAAVVQPRLGEHKSHPVLVNGPLLAELAAVREEDLGLRAVLERHAGETAIVAVERPELDVDLNTPADYEAALAAFERGDWEAVVLR